MRRCSCVLIAVALAAASCSGNGSQSPSPTQSSVRSTTTAAPVESTTTTAAPLPALGGSVIIGESEEPVTLNPFAEGGSDSAVSLIGQAHLAGAYDIEAGSLQLVPELVTELPSVGNGGVTLNADGTMTVRYQVREEAVWSDGEPITGSDLEFTLETMLAQAGDDAAPPYDVVATTASGKSFEVVLAGPTVTYETMFPVVLPEHAVAGTNIATAWNDKMWPSAGPFVVAEWQPGDYLRLVRNENYWKTDLETGVRLPYLDEVIFSFHPDSLEMVSAFIGRELDVIFPSPDPDTLGRLSNLKDDGVDVQVVPGTLWEHVNFQFGPNDRNGESLNYDRSYRQAIAYAIDPEALAALVGWVPISSILSPWDDGGPWSQYVEDVDKAGQLLAQACADAERDCVTEPPRLIFSTTSNSWERPEIADALAQMLGRIGIVVERQLEDSQLFFGETLDDGTWDVGLWAWVAGPDAAGYLATLDFFDPDAPPPEGDNYYRWGTPGSSVDDDVVARYRSISAAARESVDPEEVVALARAAEELLADNAVVIPVASRPVAGAVWADSLGGFEMNPSTAGGTWNIEFWHRLSS